MPGPESPPDKWFITARDAFNGVVLWKKKIAEWHPHLWPLKSGPANLPRRLVAVDDTVYVTLGIRAPVSSTRCGAPSVPGPGTPEHVAVPLATLPRRRRVP